jgi:transposase InsO family protein
MNNLNKLLKGEHILGLTHVHFEKNRICSACQAGKQVGAPHPAKNVLTTTRPLELLHMDIFGPVVYVSIGGNKYGFVIVADYSRYTWVFFMKEKSKVHEIFKKFATIAQNEFDVKIKRVRSDNGTEFRNTNIEEYLDEEGIGHELSVPYTPQQNGIVERKIRTLIEATRTMLDEYKTSDSFWVEAINTACHAINHLYLHKLRHKTTYELLTSKSLMCLTLEFLVVSASFLTRSPKALSLHLKLMKFLVTPQTLMAIVSSTRPPIVLKSHVT